MSQEQTNYQPTNTYQMIGVDGSNRHRIADANLMYPVGWTDSNHFVLVKGADKALIILDASGTTQRSVSQLQELPTTARFSPIRSGYFLELTSTNDQKMLHLINVKNSAEEHFIKVAGEEIEYPVLSPDLKLVSFVVHPQNHSVASLWAANVDGSNVHRVSGNTLLLYNSADFDWSPDSNRIVFTSVVDGYMTLYIVNKDGSNEYRLTTSGSAATHIDK